jgi:hypothetical protein
LLYLFVSFILLLSVLLPPSLSSLIHAFLSFLLPLPAHQ